MFHSCHHRACPRCGHGATHRWLERQRDLLLPVPYFHVVFTVPAELRRAVREHQQALVGVLFRAAFDSLQALCHDPHWLGARVGALAVLHTWTRTLEWLPLANPGSVFYVNRATCPHPRPDERTRTCFPIVMRLEVPRLTALSLIAVLANCGPLVGRTFFGASSETPISAIRISAGILRAS